MGKKMNAMQWNLAMWCDAMSFSKNVGKNSGTFEYFS